MMTKRDLSRLRRAIIRVERAAVAWATVETMYSKDPIRVAASLTLRQSRAYLHEVVRSIEEHREPADYGAVDD